MNGPREVELKLLVPDGDTGIAIIAWLQENDVTVHRRPDVIHEDIYLDTRDMHLLHAGLSCRIRTVDTHREITIKSLDPSATGITNRLEMTDTIPDNGFDALPSQSPIRQRIDPILAHASLIELFTIITQRHRWSLAFHNPDGNAILTIDSTRYRYPDGTCSSDHTELEIETAPDCPNATTRLNHLAETLCHHFPVLRGTQSKFERGMANR